MSEFSVKPRVTWLSCRNMQNYTPSYSSASRIMEFMPNHHSPFTYSVSMNEPYPF